MSVMKRVWVAVLPIAAAATVLAAPVTVRLSTVAPVGTTWDDALRKMGADWAKATEGRGSMRRS